MKKILLIIALVANFAIAKEVVIKTTMGDMGFVMFDKTAPKTVENFTTHAKNGYYNGVIFHRVIKDFMVQGGDPTGTGRGGESIWGGKFEDELKDGIVFDRDGLLAMANAGPNTNGSQFFITTKATPWLNGKHTIFGEIKTGFDILQKIEAAKTNSKNRPLKEIKIIEIIVK